MLLLAALVASIRRRCFVRNRTIVNYAARPQHQPDVATPQSDSNWVVTFLPDSIYSVINDTDRVSVSLHVYGRHVNHTQRFRFDPDQRTEAAFVLKVDWSGDVRNAMRPSEERLHRTEAAHREYGTCSDTVVIVCL